MKQTPPQGPPLFVDCCCCSFRLFDEAWRKLTGNKSSFDFSTLCPVNLHVNLSGHAVCTLFWCTTGTLTPFRPVWYNQHGSSLCGWLGFINQLLITFNPQFCWSGNTAYVSMRIWSIFETESFQCGTFQTNTTSLLHFTLFTGYLLGREANAKSLFCFKVIWSGLHQPLRSSSPLRSFPAALLICRQADV